MTTYSIFEAKIEKNIGDNVYFMDANMVIVNIEGTMIGNRKISMSVVDSDEIVTTYA